MCDSEILNFDVESVFEEKYIVAYLRNQKMRNEPISEHEYADWNGGIYTYSDPYSTIGEYENYLEKVEALYFACYMDKFSIREEHDYTGFSTDAEEQTFSSIEIAQINLLEALSYTSLVDDGCFWKNDGKSIYQARLSNSLKKISLVKSSETRCEQSPLTLKEFRYIVERALSGVDDGFINYCLIHGVYPKYNYDYIEEYFDYKENTEKNKKPLLYHLCSFSEEKNCFIALNDKEVSELILKIKSEIETVNNEISELKTNYNNIHDFALSKTKMNIHLNSIFKRNKEWYIENHKIINGVLPDIETHSYYKSIRRQKIDEFIENLSGLIYKHVSLLEFLDDIISNYGIDGICTEDDTLYIYRNGIPCKSKSHNIEQATAVLTNLEGKEIELSVEHCTECNKFFLQYSKYKRYREKYGAILGNIKMIKGSDYASKDYDLADESPLHLCGYTVSQKDGLTEMQRQDIIAASIESGAMTKEEIIKLLNWFVEVNGAKSTNTLAVKKWANDLNFVLSYDMEKQKKYMISKIEKYHRNKYVYRCNKINSLK